MSFCNYCAAQDLRITAMTGKTQNMRIHKGLGLFDNTNRCITNTFNSTIVTLGEVDFGDGNLYTQIAVESASNLPVSQSGVFELYDGEPGKEGTRRIAIIKPQQTMSRFWFRCFTGDIKLTVTGKKELFLLWRNHSSSIYAVNFLNTNLNKNLLSEKSLNIPLFSPYIEVNNFLMTEGFINERHGVLIGDDNMEVNLGNVDFEDGLYDKLMLDISNDGTIPENALFELYIDREKEAISGPDAILNVDVSDLKSAISPNMYGVFFEDINRAVDGGIYAEMIFNRSFEEKNLPSSCVFNPLTKRVQAPHKPVYSNPTKYNDFSIPWDLEDKYPGWEISAPAAASYTVYVDNSYPLAPANIHSLRIDIAEYSSPFMLVNSGFKGISVKEGEEYRLVFYLRSGIDYSGNVEALILNSGHKAIASHLFQVEDHGQYKKYECLLIPSETTHNGKFALSFQSSGGVNLDYVSLFPVKTYKNRPNGFREDVAGFVEELNPAFIRWPGGCVVEGLTMENRVKWKNTIGDPVERAGEYNLWGYHSTNGFGYHEFLQFCEDVNADGVFVCNAGLSCDFRNGDFYSLEELDELIRETLDALEYAVGDASTTKWGAERARNGRMEPFKLNYLEVGNENHGAKYAEYYNLFYHTIRQKYPDMKIITCLGESTQLDNLDGFDMNDPHFYNTPKWFYENTDFFDKVIRQGYTTYVGEYACNMGVGKGNIDAALSEAAFMIGMERNSDLVTMTSYAPLIENPSYASTPVNMIHVNNHTVFGRSSYYVQKLFSENRPDVNLGFDFQVAEMLKHNNPVGYIGLSTWHTGVEYSNIKVVIDGESVYESDFVNRPDEWEIVKGAWEIEDGILKHKSVDQQGIIILKTNKFGSKNMTIEFEAKKTGGDEGFGLIFGSEDYKKYYQMTLGSYGNRWMIFEKIVGGIQSTLNDEPPTVPVSVNKTYKIKLSLKDDLWTCFINNIRYLQYNNNELQRQYAIVGLRQEVKEIIIKVVNGEDVPVNTTINFLNAEAIERDGEHIYLSADNRMDENSFVNPRKIYPQSENIQQHDNQLKCVLKPLSLNIIKFKMK